MVKQLDSWWTKFPRQSNHVGFRMQKAAKEMRARKKHQRPLPVIYFLHRGPLPNDFTES